MQKQKQRNQSLLHSLTTLKQNITSDLSKQSYDFICRSYRTISRQLLYFVNHVRFDQLKKKSCNYNSNAMRERVEECIAVILTFVYSTEFQKYGHSLSLFGFLVHRLTKITACQLGTPKSLKVIMRTLQNQQSNRFTQFKSSYISSNEINFLTSPNFHKFLKQLQNNQIHLADPQCICCSRVFIKDSLINSQDFNFGTILGVNFKILVDKNMFKKYVSAVCRQGSGVIVVGSQKRQNCWVVNGLPFNHSEEINNFQASIHKVFSCVKPACQYQIERVIVHTNFIQKKNIHEQEMRVCFRIHINQCEKPRMGYFQAYRESKKYYQSYELNSQHKLQLSFRCETSVFPQNLYQRIHSFHQKSKIRTNCHKHIQCCQSYSNYSQIYLQYIKEQPNAINLLKNENVDEYYQPVDEPTLKFEWCTILITASVNFDREVDSFTSKLTEAKQIYELFRPFPDYFQPGKNNQRSIWLINHQTKPNDLKDLLKFFQKQGFVKSDSIKVLPVKKTLQIQKQKFKEYKQRMLESKYLQRYRISYNKQIIEIEGSKQKLINLTFEKTSQAIFAYMLFEQVHLWPYFVKERGAYLKKNI